MVLEPYLLLEGLRFRVMGHFTTFPQGNDGNHRDAASPPNGMSVFAHGHGYLIKAPATIDPTKISMYQSNPIFFRPPLPKFVYKAQDHLCLPCCLTRSCDLVLSTPLTRSDNVVLSNDLARSQLLVLSRHLARSRLLVLSRHLARSRLLVLSDSLTRSAFFGSLIGFGSLM